MLGVHHSEIDSRAGHSEGLDNSVHAFSSPRCRRDSVVQESGCQTGGKVARSEGFEPRHLVPKTSVNGDQTGQSVPFCAILNLKSPPFVPSGSGL